MAWPRLAGWLTAVVAATGACGDGGSPGPEDLDLELQVGAEVRVRDFRFSPAEVTVRRGELVRFTNHGEATHTVTADDDLFDAGEQEPGDVFTYDTARDEPGRIPYHCARHPDRMRATLTVAP